MSLNTLFCFFIGNNWQNIVGMLAEATNPYGPRIFGMFWLIIAQFILLNIVIAFVMEIYQRTANRIQYRNKYRWYKMDLYESFKGNRDVELPNGIEEEEDDSYQRFVRLIAKRKKAR
jgi:hypothetical protein